MYPHRINLREPWQTRPDEPLTYARIFNWPTELMPFEELWLVVGTVHAPFSVRFNQQPLGEQRTPRLPLEVNLTSHVRNQNLLEIVCRQTPLHGKVESAFLEVRRSVHLQQIVGAARWVNDQPVLHLDATVAGTPERNLSLVVRLNERELHYQELGLPTVAISVDVPLRNVPYWLPGQPNPLFHLEVQLLDPSCVMAQHHYQTALAAKDAAGIAIPLPADEACFESPWLAMADREGQRVTMSGIEPFLPYVWHHPCLS